MPAGQAPSFALWMPNCGEHAGAFDNTQFFNVSVTSPAGSRTMQSFLASFMTYSRTGQQGMYRDGWVHPAASSPTLPAPAACREVLHPTALNNARWGSTPSHRETPDVRVTATPPTNRALFFQSTRCRLTLSCASCATAGGPETGACAFPGSSAAAVACPRQTSDGMTYPASRTRPVRHAALMSEGVQPQRVRYQVRAQNHPVLATRIGKRAPARYLVLRLNKRHRSQPRSSHFNFRCERRRFR